MRKLVTVLLSCVLLLGLFAGCVSQEEYDQLERKYNKLEKKYDKLLDDLGNEEENLSDEEKEWHENNPLNPTITIRDEVPHTTVPQYPTDAEGIPQSPSDAKISPEEAKEIARNALGITDEQMLSPFVHIGTYGESDESCYSVQFATLDYDYEFVISAVTGEILYRSDER